MQQPASSTKCSAPAASANSSREVDIAGELADRCNRQQSLIAELLLTNQRLRMELVRLQASRSLEGTQLS